MRLINGTRTSRAGLMNGGIIYVARLHQMIRNAVGTPNLLILRPSLVDAMNRLEDVSMGITYERN